MSGSVSACPNLFEEQEETFLRRAGGLEHTHRNAKTWGGCLLVLAPKSNLLTGLGMSRLIG